MHVLSYPGSTLTAPLVIWDVDRTLTVRDTLIPFLRTVVEPARWSRVLSLVAADTALRGASRAHLKTALLRHCLAGRDYEETLAVADDFARTVQAHRCRPDSLARWSWHRARADTLVLASASPALYLEPLARSLGAQRVLATDLEVRDGAFTGHMAGPNCRGIEKARRINELIASTGPRSVWFYSDSRSDRPSFDLADIATRVRPWQTLPDLTGITLLSTATNPPGGTT